MSAETGDQIPIAMEDRAILAEFERVRCKVGELSLAELEDALFSLERRTYERLRDLGAQGLAVADANVRAAEIIDAQITLNDELQAQTEQLTQQKRQIEAVLKELEVQAAAVADANVEALFQVEDLNQQATAVADANVEAILIMDEKEAAIEDLAARAEELRDMAKELEEKVFVDSLTGLFNRRYFDRQVELEWARAKRYQRQLSVILFDVDHFKQINDQHGHQAGDEVLRELGKLLGATIRSADVLIRTSAAPVATRYGGEEFLLLLPETDTAGAAIAAERIRARVEKLEIPYAVTQPLGRLTISGGVVSLGEDDASASDLVKRADDALFKAKSSGRNRIETVYPE